MVKTINQGDGITLVCKSKTEPVWFFNDNALPLNAIISDSKIDNGYRLTITNATIYNEGFYECKGSIDNQVMRARSELKVVGRFCPKYNATIIIINATTKKCFIYYAHTFL